MSTELRWAMLCYIPVLNLVTSTLASVRMVNSKICRYHSRQGLVLFSFWVLTVLVAVISQVLSLMLLGVVLFLHLVCFLFLLKDPLYEVPFLSLLVARIPEYFIFTLLTGKKPEQFNISASDNSADGHYNGQAKN